MYTFGNVSSWVQRGGFQESSSWGSTVDIKADGTFSCGMELNRGEKKSAFWCLSSRGPPVLVAKKKSTLAQDQFIKSPYLKQDTILYKYWSFYKPFNYQINRILSFWLKHIAVPPINAHLL